MIQQTIGQKVASRFSFTFLKTLTIFLVLTCGTGHWRSEADSVLTRSLFSFVGCFFTQALGGRLIFEPQSSTRINEDDDIRLLLSQAGSGKKMDKLEES